MRRIEVLRRPFRHDAGRVDGAMAGVVVPLDMGEIHGFGDPRPLIQLSQPVRQVRIVGDPPQVAFEVTVIHRVEANQRGEQADVRFRQVFAGQVALTAQAPFQPAEFGE